MKFSKIHSLVLCSVGILSIIFAYHFFPSLKFPKVAGQQISKPSPTHTPTPTPTPSPTPTPTPKFIPTFKPVATPVPTPIPTPVVVNNTAPGAGYSHLSVGAVGRVFSVDIVAADLNSTRVIADTASDTDCSDNCPVLSLGDYVGRNGAFAGINGSFFCPASYPTCAGKTNSFDTLLMNKNKHYFNSDNNIYSVVPAVIFSGNSARFVSRSLEWGRDTGVDAVLANHPLLLLGGNNAFGGTDEAKINNLGTRDFVGTKGSTVYIGIVYNASTSDEVEVLKALGLQDALGLDQGGSTALWYGGRYIAGPGRNIPNALLFVGK